MKHTAWTFIFCSLLSGYAHAEGSWWQGTWGAAEGDVVTSTLTLRHCAGKTCDYNLNTGTEQHDHCTQQGQAQLSDATANLTPSQGLVGQPYEPNIYGCSVGIKKEGQNILIEPSSKPCQAYCVGVPFQGAMKRISALPLASRTECYASPKPAWTAWCTDEEFQRYDSEFLAMAVKIEDLDRSALKNDTTDFLPLAIAACNRHGDPKLCLQKRYEQRKVDLEAIKAAALNVRAKNLNDLESPGDAATAADLLTKIEGVYKSRFRNGDVAGDKYQSEDILEIVRVSATSLYFKAYLNFFNGHECNVNGLAHFSKSGLFSFKNEKCVITIGIDGKDIRLDDPFSACIDYCGARGSLHDTRFPLSKRKVIKYMRRLKNSREFKEAVEKRTTP